MKKVKRGKGKKTAPRKRSVPQKKMDDHSAKSEKSQLTPGEIPSAQLVIGNLYRVEHSRFGKAIVECVRPDEEGGTFVVREGELRGISVRYLVGDEFTTVNNLARFFNAPMRTWKVEAQGDTVYVRDETRARAEAHFARYAGEVPKELVTWAEVDKLPEGEEAIV